VCPRSSNAIAAPLPKPEPAPVMRMFFDMNGLLD
jgi:hypothetical protein